MALNIVWSYSNGGDPITTIVDHGNASNGSETTYKEIFLRHDGANSITEAGLYIREFSGTYSGSFTPSADLAEILAWGDASTASTFGGFFSNFLPDTYATGWPTYNSKTPTGGVAYRTGVGDSEGNAVLIPTTTGALAEGEIQTGTSPNVRFAVRVSVPDAEDTLGIRQWDHVLRFNFTS